MPSARPILSRCTAAGFSLAEVLFAMAIFTFGTLVLLGSLPNGLASLQNSRRQAAETRIFQHLFQVYQAETDRATPSELAGVLATLQRPSPFFFDSQGDLIRVAGGASNQTSFAARAQLEPAIKLPGESDPSPYLRRLRIAVTDQWQDASAFNDPARHRLRLLTLTLRGPLPAASDDP